MEHRTRWSCIVLQRVWMDNFHPCVLLYVPHFLHCCRFQRASPSSVEEPVTHASSASLKMLRFKYLLTSRWIIFQTNPLDCESKFRSPSQNNWLGLFCTFVAVLVLDSSKTQTNIYFFKQTTKKNPFHSQRDWSNYFFPSKSAKCEHRSNETHHTGSERRAVALDLLCSSREQLVTRCRAVKITTVGWI